VVVQIFKEYGYELRMIEIGVFLFKFTDNPETPNPPIITRIKEKLSLLVRSNMNSEVHENESLVNKENLALFDEFRKVISDTKNLNEEFISWLQPNK